MIPDSDQIDFENDPLCSSADLQKRRYKKRFEQHIVDVEKVTGRVLHMCGKIRHKSEKGKIYPPSMKVNFHQSEAISTEEASNNELMRIS